MGHALWAGNGMGCKNDGKKIVVNMYITLIWVQIE